MFIAITDFYFIFEDNYLSYYNLSLKNCAKSHYSYVEELFSVVVYCCIFY